MSWREIPKSVSDVLAYIPTLVKWKLMAKSGKLYYWIPDVGFNTQSVSVPDGYYDRDY